MASRRAGSGPAVQAGGLASVKRALEAFVEAPTGAPFQMSNAELFEAIFEQSPDAIIVADPQGQVRLWNPAAERLFGWRAAEVVGRSLDVIIPERLRQAHWDAYFRALRLRETKYGGRAMTTRSMRRDGTKLYVEMSFSLVADARGTVVGALAMARDVTERHEAQRRAREREASGDSGNAGA